MNFSSQQKWIFYPGLALACLAILNILLFVLLGPVLSLLAYAIFQAIFIASAVYLLGIGYGIFNDILATNYSLDYFIYHNGIVTPSRNRFVLAFTWGITATWWLALPAGILFGIAAGVCNVMGLAPCPLILPILLGAALLTLVITEFYIAGKYKINENCHSPYESRDSI